MFLLVGTPGRLSLEPLLPAQPGPELVCEGRIARCGLIYFRGRSQSFFKARFVTFSASLPRVEMRTFNPELLRIEKIAGLQYRVLSFVPWFKRWAYQARGGVGACTSLYGRASACAPLCRLLKRAHASRPSSRRFNR